MKITVICHKKVFLRGVISFYKMSFARDSVAGWFLSLLNRCFSPHPCLSNIRPTRMYRPWSCYMSAHILISNFRKASATMTLCCTNPYAQLLRSIIFANSFSAVHEKARMTFSGRLPSCVFAVGDHVSHEKRRRKTAEAKWLTDNRLSEWITCYCPPLLLFLWAREIGHKTKAVDCLIVPIGRHLPWCRETQLSGRMTLFSDYSVRGQTFVLDTCVSVNSNHESVNVVGQRRLSSLLFCRRRDRTREASD